MNKTNFKSILIIILLFSSILGIMLFVHFTIKPKKVYTEDEYNKMINNIDSLSIQLDSIIKDRDSLYNIIDSSKTQIIIIEKKYEKDYIDITNQSIVNDIEFFTNYLSKDDTRLSDSNNSNTIKKD